MQPIAATKIKVAQSFMYCINKLKGGDSPGSKKRIKSGIRRGLAR